MKKTSKRILTGIGIFVLLIVIFLVGYLIKANSFIKTMTPVKTGVITENIYAIKDSYVNMFLIRDNDQYIAVDCDNKSKTVLQELTKLSIRPDQIVAVLLTHTDGDHVAAIGLFKNAAIYLSKLEEQMINGKKSRFLIFGNKIGRKDYTLLDDQQILTIGNTKIQGILTPGHSPGSMCYLINDKYLFTGDALSLKDGKIHQFGDFINMDTQTAVKSIEKITRLPEAQYIFSAHYGYTDDYKNAVKDWK